MIKSGRPRQRFRPPLAPETAKASALRFSTFTRIRPPSARLRSAKELGRRIRGPVNIGRMISVYLKGVWTLYLGAMFEDNADLMCLGITRESIWNALKSGTHVVLVTPSPTRLRLTPYRPIGALKKGDTGDDETDDDATEDDETEDDEDAPTPVLQVFDVTGWRPATAKDVLGIAILQIPAEFEPPNQAYVELICSQQRGVGRLLMNEIERLSRANGMHRVVIASVETAIPFYRKFGFVNSEDCKESKQTTDLADKMMALAKISSPLAPDAFSDFIEHIGSGLPRDTYVMTKCLN